MKNRLPGLNSARVTSEERIGYYGLSYYLIRTAENRPPLIYYPRKYGGNATEGGFLSFEVS
jgi:hypothetical protein